MQLCPPIGSSSEVLLKDLLLKKILNSIAFNCPKFLQALRILLTLGTEMKPLPEIATQIDYTTVYFQGLNKKIA